jgi:cyclophilin family peptidyl-prolyl cis-trans isomerase
VLEQLQTEFGDDMVLAYRHFPLTSIHNKAAISAEAAEAAGAQDTFWEYHDLLFERQGAWSEQTPDEARETFIGYAEELGLDVDQFTADLDNGTYSDLVAESQTIAQEAQLTGTPSVIVNGYVFPLQQIPLNREGIEFFIDVTRLAEKQFGLPTQVIDPTKEYQATISTEKGDIVIDLFADTAPTNVNSFVYLAQNGWYDDVTFHRVLKDFMAQGGDPSGTGFGWPGYRCEDEISSAHSFDKAGMVALANSGPNTNGGQFFITFGPTPHLSDGFTIIGQVTSGQEVVDSITLRDPEQNPDFEGDRILTVTISEK